MFNTQNIFINYCKEKDMRFHEIVFELEQKEFGENSESFLNYLQCILDTMKASATKSQSETLTTKFKMIDGFSNKMFDYSKKSPIVGEDLARAMSYAFSTSEVNASMGKIVAAPTAGASGIIPAVLLFAKEKYDFSDEILIQGLLASIGVGKFIGKYGNFSGAQGGCQAETGSGAAMAAGAMVEMMGGTPEEVFTAASIALINVLGLVCDPIAGLVEYPCTFRNASGMMNALISSDMALAGIRSVVPFEEVVQAMNEVGSLMDEDLRETGIGGLAGTKTGIRIRKEFLGE